MYPSRDVRTADVLLFIGKLHSEFKQNTSFARSDGARTLTILSFVIRCSLLSRIWLHYSDTLLKFNYRRDVLFGVYLIDKLCVRLLDLDVMKC